MSGATTPLAPTLDHPPELLPAPRIELVQARRLIDSGRHLEAAEQFESLHRATGDPRYLYHAGVARLRAGQSLLALGHLRGLLSALAAPSDAVRVHVEAKIAEATALLVPVRVIVRETIAGTPQPVPLGPDARITVESADVPPLAVSGVVHVDPGRWRLRVDVPGYEPVTREQQVDRGPVEHVWQVDLVRRTFAVELRFAPPKRLRRARLRLTATDRHGVPPVERDLDGPRLVVPLTTGAWQLAVASPRGAASQALVVAGDPRPVDIVLQPHVDAAPRFHKHTRLIIAVAGGLSAEFLLGIGLSVGGANVVGKARDRDAAAREDAGVAEGATPDAAQRAAIEASYPTARLHDALRRGDALTTAGAAVMMSGLGAVVGVMPSLFEARRRLAWIELGVGGAALVGGALWMHDYRGRVAARLDPSDPAQRVDDVGLLGHRLGASMLLGLGVGVTTSTVALLLTERAYRRKQRLRAIAPYAAPGQAGLLLRGAF